ncbi:DUF2780 domain-containing protein [Shewanella surugensis]|uniref:DUF2780 domain-containing protein n=1 Tax=Shewanella surugensis TaxID=212020 RepID=A0ABT0LBU8_9GAMM|nr:DUF2780 domain-containing protein [Shewanella surugensis]MCL1125156.1 DUF2780 domain-containing protein [Shewanella surugensis]
MTLSACLRLLLLLLMFTPNAHASQIDNLTETMNKMSNMTNSVTPMVTKGQRDLVTMTMDQLGISQTQAKGGLGSLLSMAKSSLGDNRFSPIANSIPNINTLLQATPQLDTSSPLSALSNQMGNLSPSAKGGLMVYNAFDKLGLSKGLVDPMMDIIEDYLNTDGTQGASDLLMKALTPLSVTQDPLDLK